MRLEESKVEVRLGFDKDVRLSCPDCGTNCGRYDTRARSWRHLDTMQYRTVLTADVPRVQCKEHGVKQVAVPWAGPGSRSTALFVCERFVLGDEPCCTWLVVSPGQSCPGRPFLVDGRARVPMVVERSDWSRPTSPAVEGLGTRARDVHARAWAAEGCHEAASVASFSRFVLQLVALGAPAELLSQAAAAIADEVDHARAFFGLAQSYGGVPVGPAELPIDRALDGLGDPTSIAVSLATEGCIAETVSAMQLNVAAQRARDPQLRRILSEIAEQELRHAEQAWSALAWMLHRGDAQLRARVAEAFVHAQDAVPRAVSVSDELDPATLRAAGRLTATERLEVAQRALEQCVAPAATELLRPWTTTQASLATLATCAGDCGSSTWGATDLSC